MPGLLLFGDSPGTSWLKDSNCYFLHHLSFLGVFFFLLLLLCVFLCVCGGFWFVSLLVSFPFYLLNRVYLNPYIFSLCPSYSLPQPRAGVSKQLCGAELPTRASTQTRLLQLFAGLHWNPGEKIHIKNKSVCVEITFIKSRCSRKITDDFLTCCECFRPLCHFSDLKSSLERPHTKWMYLLLEKNYPPSSSECNQWSESTSLWITICSF